MNTLDTNFKSCEEDTFQLTHVNITQQDLQLHHLMANLQRHYFADFEYSTSMNYQFIEKNSPFKEDPVDVVVPPPQTRAYDPLEPGRDGILPP